MPRTNILFKPGQYGMYLQWLLYTLLVDQPIRAPFMKSKNSTNKKSTSHDMSYINPDHIKQGILIPDYGEYDIHYGYNIHASARQLRDSKLKLSTMISWDWKAPELLDESMTFADQIEIVSKLVDRVIIPYADHSTYLLAMHNSLFKTRHNGIYKDGPLRYINLEELSIGWKIDVPKEFENIPRWIQREHHSLNIFNHFNESWSWPAHTKIFKSNCLFVFLSDLFYNFLHTIENIKQFLQLEWVRDPAELLPYHKFNVSQQQHKKQDLIASQILQSIADDKDFIWNEDDLTLYTEAYIQRALRHQGIILKCDGLNNFPTSTKELCKVFE